ncbi:MAG TPA: glycosyltransferase [Flavobacterium sp.]|nr:glycosyltransferase [Flavobacterium sp.]
MRVVQIIDSLEAGGAERMAVNYANCLADQISFSGLISTRKEGVLKEYIHPNVNFICLNKNTTFDFKAILRLRRFLLENKVAVMHVHGSSFFVGVLVKLICFKVKLIWHDHYGNRIKNSLSNNWYIKIASIFFNGVIACNNELLDWAKENLFAKRAIYLPNFTIDIKDKNEPILLKGQDGKKIICLSNLRNPKNHKILLEGFLESRVFEQGWSLHLVGNDAGDNYSNALKQFIKENCLDEFVFLYGAQNAIHTILSQASIGVLASTFEGFPVVLLEYAHAELAVISTNVGQCPEIILDESSGLLFNPHKINELASGLVRLTNDDSLRAFYSSNLKSYVYENFSSVKIIKKALDFYKSV